MQHASKTLHLQLLRITAASAFFDSIKQAAIPSLRITHRTKRLETGAGLFISDASCFGTKVTMTTRTIYRSIVAAIICLALLLLVMIARYFLTNPSPFLDDLPDRIRTARVIQCSSRKMEWPTHVSVSISDKATLDKLADSLRYRGIPQSLSLGAKVGTGDCTSVTIRDQTGGTVEFFIYGEDTMDFLIPAIPRDRRFVVSLASDNFDQIIQDVIDAQLNQRDKSVNSSDGSDAIK